MTSTNTSTNIFTTNIKLVIPTLGRVKNQQTYNSFPAKYRPFMYFVVRSHEAKEMRELYPKCNVVILPEECPKGISPTRLFIFNYFKNDIIYMCDDDLMFIERLYVMVSKPDGTEKPKWTNRKFAETDFDILYNNINAEIADNKHWGGCVHAAVRPSISERNYPKNTNYRIYTNTYMNLPALNNFWEDADFIKNFNDTQYTEDFYMNLVLFTKGFQNTCFTKHFVSEKQYAHGGCNESGRNLEIHNSSQRKVKALFPDFVRLNEKIMKSGPYKNKMKISIIVYAKKSAKYGLKMLEESSKETI